MIEFLVILALVVIIGAAVYIIRRLDKNNITPGKGGLGGDGIPKV